MNPNVVVDAARLYITAGLKHWISDHNEVQNLRLRREGRSWKIASTDGAQPVQPAVPYASKATD